MKRLFGALVVTGMLLGVTASHQILAGANNNDEVCVCAPFINEVRSNGIVLLLGEVSAFHALRCWMCLPKVVF